MTKKTLEQLTRDQIAVALPRAIEQAMDSYSAFSGKEGGSSNAKAFGEHQSACKIALAHIELLLKLVKWADIPDMEAKASEMARLIESASHEISEKDMHGS